MSAAYEVPVIVARGAPLAKAGVMTGFCKAMLFAVPTALVGAALVYGLFKAFDVRWDEFNRRAANPILPKVSRTVFSETPVCRLAWL